VTKPAPPPKPTTTRAPPLPTAPPSVPPAPPSTAPRRVTATADCDRGPVRPQPSSWAEPHHRSRGSAPVQIPGRHQDLHRPPYIITAGSIVPGAVNKTNPTDEVSLAAPRVVTRLQMAVQRPRLTPQVAEDWRTSTAKLSNRIPSTWPLKSHVINPGRRSARTGRPPTQPRPRPRQRRHLGPPSSAAN